VKNTQRIPFSDPPSAVALTLRVVVAPDCLPIANTLWLATVWVSRLRPCVWVFAVVRLRVFGYPQTVRPRYRYLLAATPTVKNPLMAWLVLRYSPDPLRASAQGLWQPVSSERIAPRGIVAPRRHVNNFRWRLWGIQDPVHFISEYL